MCLSVKSLSKKLLFVTLLISLNTSLVFAANVQYVYDSLHRLVSAAYDNGVNIDYMYDELGNRLTHVTQGATNVTYEDAEDNSISGWDVYDSDPSGASITTTFDEQRSSEVIEFAGASTSNGYRLRNDDGTNWNNSEFTVIEWSAQYSENFTIYIAAQTKNGFRYIYYTPVNTDNLGNDTYIHHGLDSTSKNGEWQTHFRDLAFDLQDAQPDNELISVLGFLIRGSGRVDDIKLHAQLPNNIDSDGDTLSDIEEINTYGTNPYSADSDYDGLDDNQELSYWGTNWNADADSDGVINILDADADADGFQDGVEISQGIDPGDSAEYPSRIMYENGEDGNILGWTVYDNDPVGAFINNVYDLERDGRAIEFNGAGTSNGYRLRNDDDSEWDDSTFKVLQWSMRYSEGFVVYIGVQTKDGFRYIYYTPVNSDNLGSETYIHHGLSTDIKDGKWHTLTRDLEYDLKEAQPDNELESVLGFLVRGSGRVDDIETLDNIPIDLDSDKDTLTDIEEISTYGTHPYTADTDDDGFTDGIEILQGTDPLDSASFPITTGNKNFIKNLDIADIEMVDVNLKDFSYSNVASSKTQNQALQSSSITRVTGGLFHIVAKEYWFVQNLKKLELSLHHIETLQNTHLESPSQTLAYLPNSN